VTWARLPPKVAAVDAPVVATVVAVVGVAEHCR
jgi:hypothetical protein